MVLRRATCTIFIRRYKVVVYVNRDRVVNESKTDVENCNRVEPDTASADMSRNDLD